MPIHNRAEHGGNYLRAFPLARSLAEMGIEVTLVASRDRLGMRTLEASTHGVEVIQYPDFFPARVRHGGLSPVDLLGRLIGLSARRFDIVHGFSHRPVVSLPALAARRRKGARYISDWADLWGRGGIFEERGLAARWSIGIADHYAERWVHRRADAVTAICTGLAGRALTLGLPPERVKLVPVGVDSDAIVPLPKAEARKRYGLPADRQILAYTGFSPYDAAFLGETFVRLAQRRADVLLVKSGRLPPVFDQIPRAAGVADRVRDLGIVPYDELQWVLACGDILLLPFSDRGVNVGRFPNRFGDYLAAGRPIATNRTPDVGPIVAREEVGIAAPDEPAAFAAAISDLLDRPEVCEQMGARARRLAETRLSWRSLAGEVAAFYEQVLERA